MVLSQLTYNKNMRNLKKLQYNMIETLVRPTESGYIQITMPIAFS